MRSKTPLALMEQVVMVLVFALAAALCVQVFVLSDRVSRENAARDRAMLEAQNAVELLKSTDGTTAERLSRAAETLGGQYEQGLLYLDYDKNWNPVDGMDGVYRLTASGVSTDVPGMALAQVQVTVGGSTEETLKVLAILNAAWQTEVTEHAS